MVPVTAINSSKNPLLLIGKAREVLDNFCELSSIHLVER